MSRLGNIMRLSCPAHLLLLAGRKLINWPRELGTSIRSPLEPNEQTDSEADKKRSPADEERPSSEEPGQQDLRRRTGIS